MPKLDSTVRAASVEALANLLSRIIAAPETYLAHHVANSLSSQSALARFDDAELNIQGSALNTFKRSCVARPGGFDAVDRLRIEALAKLQLTREKAGVSRKTTRSALRSEAMKLRASLSALDGDLLLLTKLFAKAMRDARSYADASKNPALIERCRVEQNELRDMATLRRTHDAIPTHLKVVRSAPSGEETDPAN